MAETQVISLGCKLNAFRSELLRERSAAQKNTVIINTCAVTTEAERQARQIIRRTRRDNPDSRLIVTGCAAQLDPTGFAAMPEVDKVLGNREKLDPANFLDDSKAQSIVVSDIMQATETAAHLIHGFGGRARAFVEIQQGCDHRCTFCIIPFARGPNRSVGLGRIVEQVRTLVDQGFRDRAGGRYLLLWLRFARQPQAWRPCKAFIGGGTGVTAAAPEFLDPAAIDDGLFDLLATEPRLMPHLHLSIQSLDDVILKRMKRRHLYADVDRVVTRARAARPDVVFGADLIAGFPTETDAQFKNTLSSINALDITHLHVFPYSERPGTPAARMPSVCVTERKARAQRLREAGTQALGRFMANQVGNIATVLIERDGLGLSEHYAPVRIDVDTVAGQIMPVALTGTVGGHLVGAPLL